MTEFLMAGLGLVILLLAGDLLVRGAVNSALRLGIPALIVSLTIVAFGTSAPELLISVQAIHEGAPGLALGNVIGSNTANVLLVLGLPALVAGFATSHFDTRKSYILMMVATVAFVIMAYLGPFTWVHGLFLLALLAVVLGDQAREALYHRRNDKKDAEPDIEGNDPSMRWWKILLFLGLGLVGLPLGADILVDAARAIAQDYGVSDSVIGLTLVAVGTSLPELATTVMAAVRRQADVALGNVIGSNIFNLLAIIGIATLFGEIPVDKAVLNFDLWVMVGASVLLAPFVFSDSLNMTKRWGFGLSLCYVVYVVLAVSHG